MKFYFKYYGEALAKVAVGEFLIGMGAYLASNGCVLYGAHKLLLNAYGLDKDAISIRMRSSLLASIILKMVAKRLRSFSDPAV